MFEDMFHTAGSRNQGEIIPIFSVSDDEELDIKDALPETIPVLALRNTVLFPGLIIPITVGRSISMNAVKDADKKNKWIAVVSQKDIDIEDPEQEDLYKIGTIARVVKVLKMPDGGMTAILQGRQKAELKELRKTAERMDGVFEIIPDVIPAKNMNYKAKISSVRDLAKRIIELSRNIPTEAVMMLQNIKNSSFLLNFIASNLNVATEKKQEILEIADISTRADVVMDLMDKELQLLELKDQIENKVRGDIEKQQRDYFLNQQLKTIQDELGSNPHEAELNELAARAEKKKWNKETKEAFDKELNKARRINPQMAEFSVLMNYLDLMLELPWNEYTKDNFDLKAVRKVLDKDHSGLNDVKDRIIEHLAVLKLKGDMKAPIICLVGPPGVGKTSLGKSIAKAINRKFIRMSLGGLHDESEIRGHRKTYIGAMPGRIVQSIKKAKSSNPVFILDEIDKIGKDFRGDPSSALLEVLDPEQNSTFHDNYLDLDYDLSKVMFIATSNALNTIQPALLDRMEIISISGYSTEEKIEIAKKHLLPKQRKEHGLTAKQVGISDKTLKAIIRKYTRESGVRSLDRQIAGVMRGIAKKVVMEETYDKNIAEGELKEFLGPQKYSSEKIALVEVPGVVVGLAWTSVGGDILFIETSISKGKGKLTLTGNLGDVMKESATTALSLLKANADKIGIDSKMFEENDIHIHVPEGAIPKDGPSAGITMLTAITSAFLKRTVRKNLAMTGEITLRGKVLPVGGIKEKILAAKRSGITDIILCSENRKHIEEIDEAYITGLKFVYVDRMEEVLEYALGV